MLLPLTREEYQVDPGPEPEGYVAPYVHPSECDHEIDPEAPGALCSNCCPCDECGVYGRIKEGE